MPLPETLTPADKPEAVSIVDLAAFVRAEAVSMLTPHCDKSDDGHTYALAGWLAVPSAWDRFGPAWRAMLDSIQMPDGGPCRAFHAAEIVGRENISDSKFRGWSFDDEVGAFTKATDVIIDTKAAPILWPVGVATEIPASFQWVPRDAIWLILFTKLFQLLATHYPVQRSIVFMFDEKSAIAPNALMLWNKAKEMLNAKAGEEYLHGVLSFASDEDVEGIQAADFFAYEWRKNITSRRRHPDKAVRRSYSRIRETRRECALWRFGLEAFEAALKADNQSIAWSSAVLNGEPTHVERLWDG